MPMPALAPGERWGGEGGGAAIEVGFEGTLVNEVEAAAAGAVEDAAVEAVVVVAAGMEFDGVDPADGAELWTLVKMMG